MRFSSLLARSALLIISATAVLAQGKPPKRPKLPAGADTNDAHVYYSFAMDKLTSDADAAADALFWSTRLEPTWADAFYARRIALLLSDPRRLQRYWVGDRRTIESNEIRQIDSLFLRALTLNPFVSQTLDHQIFDAVADEISRGAGSNSSEVRYAIDTYMQRAPAATRAWTAYSEGRFNDALTLYAKAINEDRKNGPLHMERARIFYQVGALDSSLAELNFAIEDLRKRDKKELIYVYQSKALPEHSIGIIQQRLGNTAAAKEAFGRALQEDLSYSPAHLQLAFIAFDAKDTTTALSELETTTQLRDDDVIAHYIYGYTLALSHKPVEAESHLRRAIALNPDYAPPHYILGDLLENLGKDKEARAEYVAFLAHATRGDPRRPEADARIKSLGAGGNR